MALIKTGIGIAQISGSIAGTVFSHNRYGAYIRNRSIPVNPNSPAQQAVRADLAYLVAQWHDALSAAQRNAWAVYAAAINFTNALGDTIKLTGFNHFIRSNVSIMNCALDWVPDGPVDLLLPGTDPDFVITLSEATNQISVVFDDQAAWCSEDNGYMTIHQGMPQANTRNFFGGPSRHSDTILGDSIAPITSPQLCSTVFAIAEGQRDWITARIGRADGRLSVPFRDDALVEA